MSSLAAFVLHKNWSQNLLAAQYQHVQNFSNLLVRDQWTHTADSNPNILKDFSLSKPKTAYVFFTNFQSNYQFSWLDSQQLGKISDSLSEALSKKTPRNGESSLQEFLPKSDLEYVHEIVTTFSPHAASSDQTPLGVLRVGYVIPGKLNQMIRLGQGFRYVLPLWWALSTVFVVFLAINDLRRSSRSRFAYSTQLPDLQKTEESELTWLEDETGKTEPIFVDDQGRSWKILLDRDTMHGWVPKGNWYVDDAQLFGRPWGSSIVRKDPHVPENYRLQIRAYKMTGPDGFVVLFPCGMMQLIWIIGGWNNTRTEVLGYPSTSNGLKILKNEWYFIEVNVRGNVVEGFINGQLNFKLQKSDIKHPSPNVSFQQGMGLGVWNTLVKYADIRLLEHA